MRYTPPEIPEMTGKDLKLSGTRQDFDTRTGEPIVLMDFTDKGANTFEDDHARHRPARQAPLQHGRRRPGRHQPVPPALRDRARPRDQVVADDRLPAVPGRDLRLERRADLRPRERRRGEGSRARPPDGRTAGRVPHARPDGDLGDARQGLAPGGEEGGARRPARRRALPADRLPLPRGRRGRRADRLRGAPLRRDPDLQRHADASGHRGPRADTRGRRRREHRHLRTDQGRGARRALGPAGDPDRATRRASRRSSTPTSSRRSPRSCSSPSRPPACAASR